MERPFRSLKETFLEEQRLTPPGSVGELNARVGPWLAAQVRWPSKPDHQESVLTTAWAKDKTLLGALPHQHFNTAYVEVRRVHVAVPQIEWRGVRWSVPPACVGQRVEVRHEVDTTTVEIRWAGQLVRRHRLPAAGSCARCGTVTIGPPPKPRPWVNDPDWLSSANPSRNLSVNIGSNWLATTTYKHHFRPVPLRPRGRSRPMTANGPYEQLKDDLGYLQLGRAAECFATLAEQAKTQRSGSHIEFLARVIGRAGRGHHQPAPRRPAALRPLPVPAQRRRLRLRLPALRRPQTGRPTWPPCVSSPRTDPSCSSASPAAARPTVRLHPPVPRKEPGSAPVARRDPKTHCPYVLVGWPCFGYVRRARRRRPGSRTCLA